MQIVANFALINEKTMINGFLTYVVEFKLDCE